MIYPKNLEKGYHIGVTATSEGFTKEADINRLNHGIEQFQKLGYPVIETDNVRKSVKGRSSDGTSRAKQLMQLITDPRIRVILAASGGDYLVEMLPYLDYELLRTNPKWLQGFSDTTGLIFTVTTNLDIATIYSNNFSTFGMEKWHSSLQDNLQILEGQDIIQYSFAKYQDGYRKRITGLEEFDLDTKVCWKNIYPHNTLTESMDHEKNCHELVLQGRALGGCLDVLLNLVGTKYDKTKEFVSRYREDKILWFLESYDLGSEALIRGLWQLKEAGWFEYAAGFVFGRPAMYQSVTDTTYEEAVLTVLEEFNLPIILEADIGHKPPQLTMINGAMATIRSSCGKGSIKFERR